MGREIQNSYVGYVRDQQLDSHTQTHLPQMGILDHVPPSLLFSNCFSSTLTLQEASLILFCLKCCDVWYGDIRWWACASLQFCCLNVGALLDLTIKLNSDDGNRQCPGKVRHSKSLANWE